MRPGPGQLGTFLLAMLLAGCAGDAPETKALDIPEASDTAPDVNATAALAAAELAAAEALARRSARFDGCALDTGAFAVPATDVQAILPTGFRPDSFSRVTVGAVAGDPAGVVLYASIYCASVAWADQEFDETVLAFAGVGVLPPPEHLGEAIDLHVLGTLVASDEGVGEILRTWGVGDVGTATNTPTAVANEARVATSTMEADGFGFFLTTEVAAPADRPAMLYRFFIVEEGQVLGYVDVDQPATRHSIGGATVQTTGASGPYARPLTAGVGLTILGPGAWPFTFTPAEPI